MFRWTILFAIACTHLMGAAPALMPYPAIVTPKPGLMAINSGFRVVAEGVYNPRLEAAVTRTTDRILRQTGITPAAKASSRPALIVTCRTAGSDWPALGEDESYELDVNGEGARLSAATVTGALRGMATFVQL